MPQSTGTMPEARLRSTKKRVESFRPKAPAATQELELLALVPKQDGGAADGQKVKRKGRTFRLASWWPVGLGIFLAGFAPEWHLMASQLGIWGLRATFPLTLLASHRDLIGPNGTTADLLPQLALYLQFPLEGLLTKFTMDRGKSLTSAVVQLILLHGGCLLVLWLVQ